MNKHINYKSKKHHESCDNCATLVERIQNLEAFASWVDNLHPSRYDEISLRVGEVLETKGDYYAKR